jgi:hypothetical protein
MFTALICLLAVACVIGSGVFTSKTLAELR